MEERLKHVLFQLAKSHSEMAQLKYARNPSYNNQDLSHKAETDLIDYANDHGLFDELIQFIKQ